jgi:hypothetical protein
LLIAGVQIEFFANCRRLAGDIRLRQGTADKPTKLKPGLKKPLRRALRTME